jgi:hypothetical protein
MLAVGLGNIELRMTPEEDSHHMVHGGRLGKRKGRPDGAGGPNDFPGSY